jgi:hypothetical protein
MAVGLFGFAKVFVEREHLMILQFANFVIG